MCGLDQIVNELVRRDCALLLYMFSIASPNSSLTSCLQVSQTVHGRVLAVDPAAKRMTITLKPGLLTSKLPMIISPMHALPGIKAHGVVTGVRVGVLGALSRHHLAVLVYVCVISASEMTLMQTVFAGTKVHCSEFANPFRDV